MWRHYESMSDPSIPEAVVGRAFLIISKNSNMTEGRTCEKDGGNVS